MTSASPPQDDRAGLIGRIQALAGERGVLYVSRAEFRRATGIAYSRVQRHFRGHADLLQAAGLQTYRVNQRLDDETLMIAMREAFLKAEGIVAQFRFDVVSAHSRSVYRKRWGGWAAAVAAFRDWIERHDPAFPYIEALRRHRGRAPRRPPLPPRADRHYGPLLGFRALQHAPLNEAGVVFLFGLLAEELGFVVDALRNDFPDCEGRRRVEQGARWVPVRIEFEFRSRNFRHHGHDPAGCDLVVCWEHDWPDCPVEVLELKSAVEQSRRSISQSNGEGGFPRGETASSAAARSAAANGLRRITVERSRSGSRAGS
jgi:hypothetical protein